ncbi:MAG: diadenylate cyclase CdaA [Myxococcales bacterium]|nr:diadenylate cyclase CdaA [Polyangiaceae bacterium]MDW8249140.1 diadenylate cyclase CdaA [Myxococcales bacterium]
MLEGIQHLFSRRPLGHIVRDVLDILIVAWVIYRALLVLRGTRAQQVAVGLIVVAGVYGAAKWGGLVTLVNLLDWAVSGLFLLLMVVFQNDIRRALMRVGDKALLPGFARAREAAVVDEVIAAVTELARHRTGALIAFEQNATLDEFVVGHGIPLDAVVSRELLVTIFQPESANKLHDGAVLIRSLRIASAGVFFPMPEARNIDASLGSRHRAALGVSEETDAVVLVVSEERGTITVCYRGNMIPNLDGQRLKTVLYDLMGYKQPQRGAPKKEDKMAKKEERREEFLKTPPVPTPPPSLPSLQGVVATTTPRTLARTTEMPQVQRPGAPVPIPRDNS